MAVSTLGEERAIEVADSLSAARAGVLGSLHGLEKVSGFCSREKEPSTRNLHIVKA